MRERGIIIVFLAAMLLAVCQRQSYSVYGLSEWNKKQEAIEVPFREIADFQALCVAVDSLVCTSKAPFVRLHTQKGKQVFFQNPCMRDIACLYVKRRNQLKIVDGQIDLGQAQLPLDSMRMVLEQAYFNPQNDYRFSERPDKLSIVISDTVWDANRFEVALEVLIDAYDVIEPEAPLRILLQTPFEVPSLGE